MGDTIIVYVQEIAGWLVMKHITHPHIKTIQGYLRVAAGPAVSSRNNDPRLLPHSTDFAGKRMYIPLLANAFVMTWKWTSLKRSEQQRISVEVLAHLVDMVPTYKCRELSLSTSVRYTSII